MNIFEQVRKLISEFEANKGSSQFVALTQAEYDALAVKDPTTLYLITEA